MTYMFSRWDLRLAQVGEAGSQLGAGEPILTGPTSRSAGPRGPHAPPSPGEDQGRRNWRETFHLYIEVTAKGGPTPGSSRPFQVRSVSKGAGRTAGHPGKHVPSLNPRSPAFLGPGRQAAVPGLGGPSPPLVFSLDMDPAGPELATPPNPLLGRNF